MMMMRDDMTDDERQAQYDAEQRIQALGDTIQRRADEAVGKKSEVESRWLEDLRQYSGQYDEDVLSRIRANRGSDLYLNITRPMASQLESRLGDMLFPTDDRNWGIEPTPVPALAQAQMQMQPGADGAQPTPEAQQASAILRIARERCEAMEREIDDQLTEAEYNGVARAVIHDAIVLGTGIVKGPVVFGRTRKRWMRQPDPVTGADAQVLVLEEDTTPTVERVDPWSFFPDPNALQLSDAEYIFQRHLLTRKQLRELAKQPGFLPEQIRDALREDSTQTAPDYISQIRDISGTANGSVEGRYQVWEYHGEIDKADLAACGCEVDDDDLTAVSGVVWVCGGRVIKAALNPLETGEHPYGVYQWETDDTSLWGIGVPRLIRNAQRTVNAAVRMLMDNAGLAVGPQVVVDERIVRPADGQWALTPRKIWLKTDPTASINAAFGSFNLDSRLSELMAIIDKAQEWARSEGNIPLHMAADQATPMNETYRGAALLMNSANVVMRRAVKLWDDDITRPLISRFYDWNMQFGDDEGIKGDFRAVARGSSSLLVKEVQQQALLQLGQYVLSPALAPVSHVPEWYRELFRALQLDPDQYVKSDDQIEREAQARQKQQQLPPELQIKQAEIQAKMQIEQAKLQAAHQRWQAEMQLKQQPDTTAQARLELDRLKLAREMKNDELDHRAVEAQIQRDMQRMINERDLSDANMQMELAKMANDRQVSIEKLQAMLEMERMKLSNKTQLFNAEAAIKTTMGQGI